MASDVSFNKEMKEIDVALPYIFSVFSVEMCVLIALPDLFYFPWLCLKLMLCNKGNQNRFPVKCFPFFFPVANQTPTALTKRPLEAQASPPLCRRPYSTRVVPNQVTEERRCIDWE